MKRGEILLRTLLFAAFYGMFLINWMDIYRKAIPVYSIFLFSLYVSPAVPLVLYEANWRRTWPLAAAFILFVSLCNDLGYRLVENVVFGMGKPMLSWYEGQLGLLGTADVSSLKVGVRYPIESWQMGLSVYVRLGLLAGALRAWWQRNAS